MIAKAPPIKIHIQTSTLEHLRLKVSDSSQSSQCPFHKSRDRYPEELQPRSMELLLTACLGVSKRSVTWWRRLLYKHEGSQEARWFGCIGEMVNVVPLRITTESTICGGMCHFADGKW